MKTQKDLIEAQRECEDYVTVITFDLKTGKRLLTRDRLNFAEGMTELINQPFGVFKRVYVGLPDEASMFDWTDEDSRKVAACYALDREY